MQEWAARAHKLLREKERRGGGRWEGEWEGEKNRNGKYEELEVKVSQVRMRR